MQRQKVIKGVYVPVEEKFKWLSENRPEIRYVMNYYYWKDYESYVDYVNIKFRSETSK